MSLKWPPSNAKSDQKPGDAEAQISSSTSFKSAPRLLRECRQELKRTNQLLVPLDQPQERVSRWLDGLVKTANQLDEQIKIKEDNLARMSKPIVKYFGFFIKKTQIQGIHKRVKALGMKADEYSHVSGLGSQEPINKNRLETEMFRGRETMVPGTFATVYRAIQHLQGTPGALVALKEYRVVEDCGVSKDDASRRATREATIWITLEHENIAPFRGVHRATWTDMPLLVSLWARHGNLEKYLERTTRQSREHHIPLLIGDLIRGMEYLHVPTNGIYEKEERNLYHGDLHGHNLLVDERKDTKEPLLWIADFGLSGDVRNNLLMASQVTHRTYVRTPEMSRYLTSQIRDEEAIEQRKPLMQRADIYSLGIMIFWMMTGEWPFTELPANHRIIIDKFANERTAEEAKQELQNATIRKHTSIHPLLFQLLEDCWKIDPDDRPKMPEIRTRYFKLGESERAVQGNR